MIEKALDLFGNKISLLLYKRGMIKEVDLEAIEYLFKISLFNSLAFFMAFVIGLFFHSLYAGIVTILPYMMIRKYAGGYHAKSINTCIAMSAVMIFCGIWYGYFPQMSGLWRALIELVSVLVIILLAPIESEKRGTLSREERKARKIRVSALTIVWILIRSIFGIKYLLIANLIGSGIVSAGLLVLLGFLSNKCHLERQN